MEPEPNSIHVLLVEDDEDDFVLLRDCLAELGSLTKFELDWVPTYQAGLTQIQRANHDVYLIDHYLGKSSGLDLLKEALQGGCQEPIIIITGQSAPEIDQAALQAGATDYLEKDQIMANFQAAWLNAHHWCCDHYFTGEWTGLELETATARIYRQRGRVVYADDRVDVTLAAFAYRAEQDLAEAACARFNAARVHDAAGRLIVMAVAPFKHYVRHL